MFSIKNISPNVTVKFDHDIETIMVFYSDIKENKTIDQVSGRVTGINLSYASCTEQNYGIKYLLQDFKAKDNGQIKRVPRELSIQEKYGVSTLCYGSEEITREIADLANYSGVIGYWDWNTLFVCASAKYRHIPYSLLELLKSSRTYFAFKNNSIGKDLVIIEKPD